MMISNRRRTFGLHGLYTRVNDKVKLFAVTPLSLKRPFLMDCIVSQQTRDVGLVLI